MKWRKILALMTCLFAFSACQTKEEKLCTDPNNMVSSQPKEEVQAGTIPPENILEPPAETPAADPQTTKETVSGEGFLTEIENQVMNLINQERLSLGLTELEFDPMLQNGARIRCKELCQQMSDQKLSHSRPDGSNWSTVLTRDIPVQGLTEAGEILAREKTTDGDGSTQEAIPAKDWFLLWKASQPHYDTITWPEAEKMGVGIYYEIRNGEYYTNAAVLFGIYRDDLPEQPAAQ